MSKTRILVGGALAAGLLLASPAFAKGGLYCAGGNGGCSNSPVTTKSCSKELKSDTRALVCDVVGLFIDLITGRPIRDNIAEIQGDAQEIAFDKSVLASLRR